MIAIDYSKVEAVYQRLLPMSSSTRHQQESRLWQTIQKPHQFQKHLKKMMNRRGIKYFYKNRTHSLRYPLSIYRKCFQVRKLNRYLIWRYEPGWYRVIKLSCPNLIDSTVSGTTFFINRYKSRFISDSVLILLYFDWSLIIWLISQQT